MANGVTSQWDDIHVKLGNYEARPEVISQKQIREENYEKMENFHPLDNKDAEELDSLDDEIEAELRKMYKQEIREETKKKEKERPYFGGLIEIGKEDYVAHVNNAPPDVWVVIHLYQPSIEHCTLLNSLLGRIAEQQPYVKFIKIVANKCIENFPDINCPAVIFYRNGKMASFLYKVHYMVKMNMTGVNDLLVQQGVLESNQLNEEEEEYEKIKGYTRGKLDFKQQKNEDISDSDEDDREYENTKIKKFRFR